MPALIPILAVSAPDAHLAIKLLQWIALMSRARPAIAQPLIVFHAKSLDAKIVARLHAAAEGIQPPPTFATPPEIYEHGYAASANYQFRCALEYTERHYPGCPTLWLEADVVPVAPGWIDEIQSEYDGCGKPFMGDFVPQLRGIDHMTGIGVYPPNWRELAPSIALLPDPRPEQGWDSKCAHEIVPQMHRSLTIRQVWRPPLITRAWANRNIPEVCSLFHQCKDGSLIDVLCDEIGVPRIPLHKPFAPSTYPLPMGAPQQTVPRTEILIVTFKRDMDFLRYCLKSIRHFGSGFSGVTVLAPSHEKGLYDWVKRDAVVKYFEEPPGQGMMSAQIQKLRADEWCPHADVIVTMDADCMFFRHTTPAAFVKDWRCLMVREAYTDIGNPNRHTWKHVTEKALGWQPEYDTMVRHPQVHPRQVYELTRAAVEVHTDKKFNEYVLGCKNDFPQGFCEWVTVGAVAHRYLPECYNMVDYDHTEDVKLTGQAKGSFQYAYKRTTDHVVEFWSHSGVARYKSDCEAILAGRIPAYWVK
jgi:hypothetical protein